RMALYPVDPVGPGTWVGVNESGLAAALLNRSTRHTPLRAGTATLSRVLIVPRLLDELTLRGAIAAARQLDLSTFESFRIVLVESGAAALLTCDDDALQ